MAWLCATDVWDSHDSDALCTDDLWNRARKGIIYSQCMDSAVYCRQKTKEMELQYEIGMLVIKIVKRGDCHVTENNAWVELPCEYLFMRKFLNVVPHLPNVWSPTDNFIFTFLNLPLDAISQELTRSILRQLWLDSIVKWSVIHCNP